MSSTLRIPRPFQVQSWLFVRHEEPEQDIKEVEWKISFLQERCDGICLGWVPQKVWETCSYSLMLQSAVGKTHVLRSGLVMNYVTSYFSLIVLGYPLDSKRSYEPQPDTLCPGACGFPPQGPRGQFGPITCLVTQFLAPAPRQPQH